MARGAAREASRAGLIVRLDLGARGRLGPGKIALLKSIGAAHSIAAAARALGMSYRRAWLLLEELQRQLGTPVIVTHVGGRGRGGAELTAAGAALIEQYEAIQATARRATAAQLKRLERLLRCDSPA
jgi:molybdate transport system regulatory protein